MMCSGAITMPSFYAAMMAAQAASEQSLESLCNEAWIAYASQRWAGRGKADKALWRLTESVGAAYERLRSAAGRAHRKIEFSRERLLLLAIRALADGCLFCGDAFGVEAIGIVLDERPSARVVSTFGLRNVLVCCQPCAGAKGLLSGSEWLDVMAAFRAAESGAQARAALAVGWGFVSGKRGKGTSPGVRGDGNALASACG